MRNETTNRRRGEESQNSNRYTVRIEFPVSYRKQTAGAHSDRYNSRGYVARLCKINRQPELIESHVSRSKQSPLPKINRQLSCPFCPDVGRESAKRRRSNGSGGLLARPTIFTNPKFLIATAPRIEIPVSYRKQRTGPFLIATRNDVSPYPETPSRICSASILPAFLLAEGESQPCRLEASATKSTSLALDYCPVPVSFTVWGLVEAASVIVAAPLIVPVAEGVNVTLRVQDALAATLAPHGVVPPEVTEKSPLPTKLVSVSAVEALFVTVSVCAALVVPTVCAAKVRLAGAIVTGTTAVPVILITCCATAALSEITTAPCSAPLTDGENVTLSVQLALGARAIAPHGMAPLPDSVKSPVEAIEEIVTLAALVFCTMTDFAALVVPTAWLANASEAGVNFSGAAEPPVPLPVSFTSSGLYAAA